VSRRLIGHADAVVSVTAKAVWFIESHLSEELSLDVVARTVGVSKFHLSRAFSTTTGVSASAYIRSRRLSRSAQALANGAPDILAVALDSGYGSHEAFTRAFRQQFGLAPEQLRERGDLQGVSLMNPIRIADTSSSPVMTPRVVSSEAMLIFGLSERHTGSNARIPSQWERFVPHLGHLANQVGSDTFGVICNTDDAGTMEYVCGVQVSEFPAEPAAFARRRIPPQTYAVFHHRDHVSAVSDTWKAIWNQGLPGAGLDAADGPSFERYGASFDGRTGAGGFEIWVPVRAHA
jgi:AraC family transcriptional regulator